MYINIIQSQVMYQNLKTPGQIEIQKYNLDDNIQEIKGDDLQILWQNQNNKQNVRSPLNNSKKQKSEKKRQPMDGSTMINPKEFFQRQCESITDEYMPKISEFVKTLIDYEKCVLCKKEYNLEERMPRIMIHCGHTFCQNCLQIFHKEYRVRCPLCLKLIRNIDVLERLPVNHTIFKILCEKQNEINRKEGKEIINVKQVLLQQFQQACQRYEQVESNFNLVTPQLLLELRSQQPPNPNKEINISHLEMGNCPAHPERVQHFFCAFHRSISCRVCTESRHSHPQCFIVELYEVEDVHAFIYQVWDLNFSDQEIFGGEQEEDGQGEMENYVDLDDEDDEEEEDGEEMLQGDRDSDYTDSVNSA